MTGVSRIDSRARRTASRSSANSPSVELTNTRSRWSGVRIMLVKRLETPPLTVRTGHEPGTGARALKDPDEPDEHQAQRDDREDDRVAEVDRPDQGEEGVQDRERAAERQQRGRRLTQAVPALLGGRALSDRFDGASHRADRHDPSYSGAAWP